MAHKKAGSTAKTNRDSISKRLGIKLYGGEKAFPGNIIVRQKGSKFHPGIGTKLGSDFTIYTVTEGKVKFRLNQGKKVVDVV